MPSSQHRPGAKVSKSPAAYAKEKMQQVEQLEKQLQNLPSKKSDEQKSRLRIQLCEMLSDVIITDPQSALKYDCIGRLWRGCFYDTISVLRHRITKEEKKNGPNLAKLQKSLEQFISEAVLLYNYLIDGYQKKLIPPGVSVTPGSQQSSQSLSQSSVNDSQSQTPESTDTTGVVPGLFRMYIHLGDLHRYAGKYKDSQVNYATASKLSPGRGNPYNQLAVVSQLKKETAAPLNAVALYWYARSLLTTDEPFEVAKANLSRLFQSNRDWFQNQPPVEEVLRLNGGNGKQEMTKSAKKAASGPFLSQFVDLHHSFFRGIISDEKKTNQGLLSDEDVIVQIEALLGPLSVLLRNSAFGDPLLCKLVVICAFSESYRPEKNEEIDLQLTRFLARMLTFSFGACLADRVAIGLAKIKDQPEKIGNPGKAPSVRLLQPLLLVCEYVESCPIEMKKENLSPRTASFCETTINSFWQKIVDVLNLLSNFRGAMNLEDSDWESIRIKEFHGLIGYAPFMKFLEDPMASNREDGFASIEEAIDVLELPSTEQSSQDSTPSAGEEYKIKVARLLALGNRMAEDSTQSAGRRFGKNSNGAYVWNDTQEDEDSDDAMMDVENTNENDTQPLPAGRGDDVLVYSVPQGGGPALLVPGVLLQNRALGSSAENDAFAQKSSTNNGSPSGPSPGFGVPVAASTPAPMGPVQTPHFGIAADAPNARDPPSAPPAAPPTSIMPPPGFGGASPAARSTAPAMPQGQIGTGSNPGVPPYASGLEPTGLNSGMPVGFGRGVSSAMQQREHQSYQPTLANSMHLFGGPAALQTENPFAAASMPPLDAEGNMTMMDLNLGGASAMGGSGALFFNPGPSGAPNSTSTLLGSGLLNSLFEDSGDKSSSNPFAT